MKVCTDACLFGSVIANLSKGEEVKTVLDIGAGTGLLSLMYAQANADAVIDAVEIDNAAAQQAKENFDSSPWEERLNIHSTSIQQFADLISRRYSYDLIIANPPFYEGDLKSDDKKRNLALHSAGLNLEELIHIANDLLNDDGNFFVLTPYSRTEYLMQLVQQKFFIKEMVFVKQTSKHNYFRSLFWLTKKAAIASQSEIIIMNEDGKYSNEFTELLNDYYLYLE